MKQLSTITALILGMFVMFATSCTKEGPQGEPGKDGTDGTVNCIKCHDNSQDIELRQAQWAASIHATGGHAERNAANCAPCHTSQGFVETAASGNEDCAATIDNPSQINCYTCHQIHKTYTKDDWAFNWTDPVDLRLGGTSDQGKANLCVKCHQGRALDAPLDPSTPTASYTVSSSHFGAHHGPQGNMMAGLGGYELGTGYSNSSHTTMVTNSCVDCHMSAAYGTQAGGHTWNMIYGTSSVNTTGCTSCHTDATALKTKITDTQDEIEVLLDSLGTILETKGLITSSGSAVTGTFTMDEAGAVYNYKFVEEDRSLGVHNYNYAKKLLENTITAATGF